MHTLRDLILSLELVLVVVEAAVDSWAVGSNPFPLEFLAGQIAS